MLLKKRTRIQWNLDWWRQVILWQVLPLTVDTKWNNSDTASMPPALCHLHHHLILSQSFSQMHESPPIKTTFWTKLLRKFMSCVPGSGTIKNCRSNTNIYRSSLAACNSKSSNSRINVSLKFHRTDRRSTFWFESWINWNLRTRTKKTSRCDSSKPSL